MKEEQKKDYGTKFNLQQASELRNKLNEANPTDNWCVEEA